APSAPVNANDEAVDVKWKSVKPWLIPVIVCVFAKINVNEQLAVQAPLKSNSAVAPSGRPSVGDVAPACEVTVMTVADAPSQNASAAIIAGTANTRFRFMILPLL